jgi:hypothetical protein
MPIFFFFFGYNQAMHWQCKKGTELQYHQISLPVFSADRLEDIYILNSDFPQNNLV